MWPERVAFVSFLFFYVRFRAGDFLGAAITPSDAEEEEGIRGARVCGVMYVWVAVVVAVGWGCDGIGLLGI